MFVVFPIGETEFVVLSLNSTSGRPKQYFVKFSNYRFICNCPNFLENMDDPNFVCKHVVAVLKAYGEKVSSLTAKPLNTEVNNNNIIKIKSKLINDSSTIQPVEVV